ncbi:enoyl-CoA hydratase-related protein [Parafrankia sp. FMc6]|uniref:enoyl-CoA hydratase/isomerase family protein n=1 Tax=Parafrankia soli TaxID=2599596 RepID=UPI0034D52833
MATGDFPGYPTPWMYDDPGRDVGPKARDCWKPVIAAVHGMACGAAFYLLGEVEFIIIAGDDATFFDPHVTYGMTAAFESIQMLTKMPFQEIMRMSLLGVDERMSAGRACEIGLVSEVVPVAELCERAGWAARVIADSPPVAVQGTMRALWTGLEVSRQQGIELGQPVHPDRDRRGDIPRRPAAFRVGQASTVAPAVTVVRRPLPMRRGTHGG